MEEADTRVRDRSADVAGPWEAPADEVLRAHDVALDDGLSHNEAAKRLTAHGPNMLREPVRRSVTAIFVDQLRSMVVLLLIGAAIASIVFVGFEEAIAIFVVVVLNTVIGFFTELRAVRSMDALRSLGTRETLVRRDGQTLLVAAQHVVPGDIVVLEGGDVVTADLRLARASRLRADESTFTGESLPVAKHADALPGADRVDQRGNMLFKGTSLTRGSGEGVVVATGMNTELGRISELAEEAEPDTTPLEKRLDRLANVLILVTLAIAVVVAAAGIIAGKPVILMIETGIALAVATIPEGLPIVATIALARGLWRMSRRNALVNRLAAVETLGATSVICTDKTGTLTENRLHVDRAVLSTGERRLDEPDPLLRAAIEIGVLCNNASLGPAPEDAVQAVGDPLEVALLLAGAELGIRREALVADQPEIREIAFDSVTKRMATYHETEDGVRIAVKGAPEAVLECCVHEATNRGEVALDDAKRAEWLDDGDRLAETGLRMIAVAQKRATAESPAFEGLTLVGLIALVDPPRRDVSRAISACHGAGIRVLMLTGDHPATAGYVADAVGLDAGGGERVVHGEKLSRLHELDEDQRGELRRAIVFARVSPEQKLDLIALHQESGAVVGMVGDGVNDAPALKLADIGIAMGQRGTQVAREAADMVLTDDAFDSIVCAIEEGRAIFRNIRRFVFYLLSCNVGEVMIIATASVLDTPLPILPLQILFLNLVSDVFPALALGMGEATPNTLRERPRSPKVGILTREHALGIGVYGTVFTLSTLVLFFLALDPLDYGPRMSVTLAFLTLAFGQLWHVFNMRDASSGALVNEVTKNPHVWGALFVCVAMLLVAVYVPVLASVLDLSAPSFSQWLLVLGFSVIPLIFGQAWLLLASRTHRSTAW